MLSAISDDQDRMLQLDMLRASALAFAAKESPPSRARALRNHDPGFDPRFWNALAAQGWTGLLVPESAGGYGQGYAEMAVVTSALAAQAAPEPVIPVMVFAGSLLRSCASSSDTARQLLIELAAGRLLPAVAWQEDVTGTGDLDAHGGLGKPASLCRRSDAGLTLRGAKRHIRPGASASGHIVTASAEDGLALVWMPAQSAGSRVTRDSLADGTYAGRLEFDGVVLPKDHLLASGVGAVAALAAAYDETLVLTGIELQAVSQRMLDMTLDYLRNRKQFGKPIGSFQSLQHRVADLLIQQQLAGALAAQAVKELDEGSSGSDRALLAARVKTRCSHTALMIGREAVQLHGAIGVTDEYDLGLYLQRVLVLSAWLGNAAVQRKRFAALARRADERSGVA